MTTFAQLIGAFNDAGTLIGFRNIDAAGTITLLGSLGAPAQTSSTYNVGDTAYFPLPAGVLGTIQVLRNGVPIAGAVSAPNSNSYSYVLVLADDQQSLSVSVSNVSYDTAAPRRFSIETPDAERDAVYITFDKTMQLSPINLAHFTMPGKTMVSATAANSLVKLKFSPAAVYGEANTVSLTANGSNDLCDYAGNLAATFTNLAVANNIDRGAVPLVLETGVDDGTNGYFISGGNVLTHGSADYNYFLRAQSTASGIEWLYGEGWIEMRCSDSSAVRRTISLTRDANQRNDFKQQYMLFYFDGLIRAAYTDVDAANYGELSPDHVFAPPSANCWARLHRSNGTVKAEYSNDNKATWTVFATYPTDEVDPLYGRFGISGAGAALLSPGIYGFVPDGLFQT